MKDYDNYDDYEDDYEKENNSYGYYELNKETGEYEFHCEEWETVDEKIDQMKLEGWKASENPN